MLTLTDSLDQIEGTLYLVPCPSLAPTLSSRLINNSGCCLTEDNGQRQENRAVAVAGKTSYLLKQSPCLVSRHLDALSILDAQC